MNKEEAIKQLKKHKQEIDKQYISSRYSKAIEVALNLIQKQDKTIDKMAEKINQALDKLENEPYVAYTFYGDILHESDEIINILKGE